MRMWLHDWVEDCREGDGLALLVPSGHTSLLVYERRADLLQKVSYIISHEISIDG